MLCLHALIHSIAHRFTTPNANKGHAILLGFSLRGYQISLVSTYKRPGQLGGCRSWCVTFITFVTAVERLKIGNHPCRIGRSLSWAHLSKSHRVTYVSGSGQVPWFPINCKGCCRSNLSRTCYVSMYLHGSIIRRYIMYTTGRSVWRQVVAHILDQGHQIQCPVQDGTELRSYGRNSEYTYLGRLVKHPYPDFGYYHPPMG